MQNFTTAWRSGDGIELFAQGWQPVGDPKAVVCLLHGLGEHSGRYAHVAEALTAVGYALLTFDLRGHGRSSGKRGHFANFEVVLDDVDRLLQEAETRYPGKPRFLYGHSLGGLLVLYYTLLRKPVLAGVISSGPALRSSLEQQKAKIAIARVLSAFLPAVGIPTGLDAAGLSHDPQVISAYRADPLVHGLGTPAFATGTLKAIAYIFEHAGEFDVPLLLTHGTDDPIAYAAGSREIAGCVGQGCTLKLWEGMFHETHNEPEKAKVLAYLVDWLDAQLRAWQTGEPVDVTETATSLDDGK